MMGFQGTPAWLFYDFCLEEHVPVDHMLRGIDRHLALDDLRQSLKPFYSQMGRPSVDPELMIRMLIVGHGCQLRWFRLARWEALGRVQASLRAQRPAASADRMG